MLSALLKSCWMRLSDGEIDRLYVISNEFVNTMTQRPVMEQLLPVVAD